MKSLTGIAVVDNDEYDYNELQADDMPPEVVKGKVDSLLTKISERANIVYEKKSEYGYQVLENLYEDLYDALKNLKKGR